jgi:hypothetical protein
LNKQPIVVPFCNIGIKRWYEIDLILIDRIYDAPLLSPAILITEFSFQTKNASNGTSKR